VIIDDIFIEFGKYNIKYDLKRAEHVSSIKDDKIDQLTLQIQNQSFEITTLNDRFQALMNRTEDIHTKLDVEQAMHQRTHDKLDGVIKEITPVLHHIVPEIMNDALTDHLLLLHNRDSLDHYYIVRCQKRVITTSLQKIKKEYPLFVVLTDDIDYTHPKNLFVLLKEYIQDHSIQDIFIHHNHIHVFNTMIRHSTIATDHPLIQIINVIKESIVQPIRTTF
jgi:hypothetical protein